MNKPLIIGIVVLLIVIAGGGGFLLIHNNPPKPANNPMSNMNMSSSNASSIPPSSTTNNITIQNFAFNPNTTTVKKGTTVTWTNNDSATHTVTENDAQSGGPNSSNIAPGKSYSFTFTATGTFKYHCTIHPDMLGIVTVTE